MTAEAVLPESVLPSVPPPTLPKSRRRPEGKSHTSRAADHVYPRGLHDSIGAACFFSAWHR
eukprot:12866279-Alexandrium_andersonii.AAC.1